jgi:hypothetical protein
MSSKTINEREEEMDPFTDERDELLLEKDRVTFSVLKQIMKNCQYVSSDHEKLIICFSCLPFPVWIWTADDATEEEKEKAYQLTMRRFPPEEAYTYNLKYDLAEYFIERSSQEGKTLSISIDMYAYECSDPVEPAYMADGCFHRCKEEDIGVLVEFMDLFHREIGIDQQSLASYRNTAEEDVRNGYLYFWKNNAGKPVACCHYHPNGSMASIGLVYTRKEDRRHHYAQNLVYQVTKIAIEQGYLPVLYTDANYLASNACYEKIGYLLRGKLCTIGLS